MADTWERNSQGELIPRPADVILTDEKLVKAINFQKFKLAQSQDEKRKAILQRAVELLEEALKEKTKTLKILYTPLLHCEIVSIRSGLGLEGFKTQDLYSEICSKHCLDPKLTFNEWRDLKDPTEKVAIADFIVESSIPKKEKSEKEEEAFQLLHSLVYDIGRTDLDTLTLPSVDLPNGK